MKCASCQRETDASDRFCPECGAALLLSCANCGISLKPGAKFCAGCGTPATPSAPHPQTRRVADYTPSHLAERIRAEQIAFEARGAADGERKTITALFADLKGSTALIEGLDPEEVRAIIDPALQHMMDAVHHYDGYVAQALGDGIFALFGAPLAHEDHPQRGVYAALRMQEAMSRYGDALRARGFPPLLMRVGLNTGEVVVRSIRKDDLHADYVPVGHSTNLAARMEQLATPGSVVVSAFTHRLIEGYFAFKALGSAQVKGLAEPIDIYEVLGVGPLRTRLQVSVHRGLTQFVGRQSELNQLQRAMEVARTGRGQVVAVMGEPGLGKSRLFYEFKRTLAAGSLIVEAYSASHGKATAFLPVIELFKSYFRIDTGDDERTRREKVVGKVLMLDRSLEDTLPYLFALLDIELLPSPLQQMDAQIRRSRTCDALKKLLLRESMNQPLVVVFEDLHWIDSETQGLLDLLCESLGGARLLLLTNYRPEYRHEWGQKTYCTQMRLAPLGRDEAEEMLFCLLGRDPSLGVVYPLILEKTQGTPFFMEEVVQTLAEDGSLAGAAGHYRLTRPLATLQLPSTVQAILAARIDRLAAEEKSLLQQLAVIGREFPLSLVRRVITVPEAELYRLLAALQRKEFLYERPAFPEVEYVFKHALTQEVAYGTVLQERRKVLHEQTAQALETLYAIKLDDQYGALARHYSRSGNVTKAVEYLNLAGQQAARHSANTEAIAHLGAALALLEKLPDAPARARYEYNLQLNLGASLQAVRGWASSDAEHAFTRAYALSADVGADPFRPLWGMAMGVVVRAEFDRYDTLGRELMNHATASAEPLHAACAHWAAGQRLFHCGDVRSACAELEQAMLGFDRISHTDQVNLLGADFGVFTLSYLSHAQWCMGLVEQAVKTRRAAGDRAREFDHAFSTVLANAYAAVLHALLEDTGGAEHFAGGVIELCRDQGFDYYLGWGEFVRGWVNASKDGLEAAGDDMQRGLERMKRGGARLRHTYYLALLAESLALREAVEPAKAALDTAFQEMMRTREHCWQAELYRVSGVLAEGTPSGIPVAEGHYRQAVATAREQGALSWELRASLPLARLLANTTRRAEARAMLVELRQRFVEGADGAALRRLQAMLDALA